MRSSVLMASMMRPHPDRRLWRAEGPSALGFLLLSSTPLWAIPSPDVVLGLFASAAQLLGLATVAIGGVAWSRKRRGAGGRLAAQAPASRWPLRLLVVVLFASLAANALQYARGVDRDAQRLRRNLVRSSKENGASVGDTNLKTLSFSDQLTHPLGVSSDDLARWIEEDRTRSVRVLNMVDVREPEEVEMGRIEGSWHMRYPDLRLTAESLKGSAERVLILCYSGNRSSELVQEFVERGIDCRFLIGGYEKWISEGRPMDLPEGHTSGDLRALPSFPNDTVLLDTPDVERLVHEREPIFVDVRYPGDFEISHLPGAINITIRSMPSDAMMQALCALPKRPIIAPCYDKRTSFYASILGLRLSRLGYEFLGRYTVPHEYMIAQREKPHVEQFLAGQDAGLLGLLAGPLATFVRGIERKVGHLAVAIILAVILLRLVLAPLTLKSERDQFWTRRLRPKIRSLRKRFAQDPARASRAILALQRRARLTPGRNLLGSMVQLVLFIGFFSAVATVCATSTVGFLWIGSLAAPDPIAVLPIALALLAFLQMEWGVPREGVGVKRYTKTGLRLAGAVLLGAITFPLAAALQLYLLVSIAFLFIQSRLVHRALARRERWKERVLHAPALPPRCIAPLALAHRVPGCGNKALKLAQLKAAGFPVPDGFVVTASFFGEKYADLGERRNGLIKITASSRRKLDRAWKRLGAERVAVRSSGLNEDGADKSYAGVFESILDVDAKSLVSALETVHSSLHSARAHSYSALEEAGGVLVQKMIPAQYAGVLFSEHPTESGTLLIELVEGLGEALVSGASTPRSFRYGRVSLERLDEHEPPIDLRPLIALARRVESLYGRAQDIEWAWAQGQFRIVQTRDVTVLSTTEVESAQSREAGDASARRRRVFERERQRLLATASKHFRADSDGAAIVLEQNELSELLPRPTPLSLSFMRRLWSAGGSADLACRELGVPFAIAEDASHIVETAFGALYVHRLAERDAVGKGPGAIGTFRLAREADAIENELREEILPEICARLRLRETMQLSRLSRNELAELFRVWSTEFVEEIYVHAERANIAADLIVKDATRRLEARGLCPVEALSGLPETVVGRAMALLPAIAGGERAPEEFLELFGHRSVFDWELASPRYRERPEAVLELARDAGTARVPPASDSRKNVDLSGHGRMLRIAVERAQRFQALKEEAKHHALRALAMIRQVLVELDRQVGLEGDIFWLEVDEIAELTRRASHDRLVGRIVERKELAADFREVSLPARLSVRALEALEIDGESVRSARPRAAGDDAGLRGLRVAGSGDVVGRARLVLSDEDLGLFEDGEVLVARFTDPRWTPLFPRSTAVVTEVGGQLSHAAIVAREHGVTAVVGVDRLLEEISNGDLVRVHADGQIERVDERRRGSRLDVRIQASIARQGQILDAIIHDLSETGALVSVPTALEDGQDFTISFATRSIHAEVVRHDADGRYGVRFTHDRPSES